MYLDFYIAKLLEQHECVIVPDFGAFISNDRQSYISESDRKIYPASKRLAFNPSLSFNDGLLINSISFFDKISYNEATDLVKKSLEIWRKKLSEKESLLLIGIGELVLNDDQKLIFTPLLINTYHSESFGLPELQILPVVRMSPELASIEKEITYSMVDDEEGISEVKHHHKTNKSRKVLYYSLTAYIPLIIGLWAVLFFADPFNRSNESSLNPMAGQKKPAKESIVQNEKQPANQSIQNKNINRSDNMDIASVVTINEQAKSTFYVIGGSFKSYKNAVQLQQDLQTRNFNSNIIKSANNQYRVTYSKFSTLAEAENYLQSVRQSENSSAWILNESK